MFERLHVVGQPVPTETPDSSARARSIVIRELARNDISLQSFERGPGEIAERFDQGAVCLGAFRKDELIGWLWFVQNGFRDRTYPLRVVLEPRGVLTWDFDVYVRPDARLSLAFARLWEAAFDIYRQKRIVESLSVISGANPASLRAHRRLGIRELGTVLIARIGRITMVFSRQFAPRAQLSVRHGFVATLVIRLPRQPGQQYA